MRIIETLDEWNKLSKKLSENGWSIWQTQYNPQHPEGYHAWFHKTGKPNYEIMTYNNEVYKAIPKYKNPTNQ